MRSFLPVRVAGCPLQCNLPRTLACLPTRRPASGVSNVGQAGVQRSCGRASQGNTHTSRSVATRMLPPQTPEAPISREGLSVQSVTTALFHASRAWDKYDLDKSGTMSHKETVDLLNSHELQDAALLLTNVAPTRWTEEDLQAMFQKADSDRSGCLTRTEFLALYLAVTTHRVRKNPLVLAEAMMGFLDADRNGKIEGKELKVLLTLLGFPVAMMMPIPSNFGVDYRSILRSLGGNKHTS